MNKKTGIIIGVLVLVFLAGSGLFFLSSRKNSDADVFPTGIQDQVVGTLTPTDIGLKLILNSNNRKVKVIVENIDDIKLLEYDITYDADIPASELAPGEEGGKVERGFSDEAKIKSGQSRYESKDFDLGSCSRNVCRYDTGVEEVRILMKVTKRDGKIYEVKDEVKL